MNPDKNFISTVGSIESSEISDEEFNARLIAKLKAINPKEWAEKIDQLAIIMQKKPKWSRNDQRIEHQVENIFYKFLKELVFTV